MGTQKRDQLALQICVVQRATAGRGEGISIVVAAALTRLISSLLFHVSPVDPSPTYRCRTVCSSGRRLQGMFRAGPDRCRRPCELLGHLVGTSRADMATKLEKKTDGVPAQEREGAAA
jgi:hypothetical protein